MHTTDASAHRLTRLAIVGASALLVGLLVLYIALVVIPFFRHGLLWRSEQIALGAADPRNFAPFAWDGSGHTLYTLALVLAWFSPFIVAGVMGAFGLLVAWNRQRLSARTQIITKSIGILGLSSLLFMCTIGLGIATWLLD